MVAEVVPFTKAVIEEPASLVEAELEHVRVVEGVFDAHTAAANRCTSTVQSFPPLKLKASEFPYRLIASSMISSACFTCLPSLVGRFESCLTAIASCSENSDLWPSIVSTWTREALAIGFFDLIW